MYQLIDLFDGLVEIIYHLSIQDLDTSAHKLLIHVIALRINCFP